MYNKIGRGLQKDMESCKKIGASQKNKEGCKKIGGSQKMRRVWKKIWGGLQRKLGCCKEKLEGVAKNWGGDVLG